MNSTLAPQAIASTQIAGLGIGLPRQTLLSSQIDARLGKPDGWLFQACGVSARPIISGDESQISLGIMAAQAALADAELDGSQIDLLLFGASVGYQPIPATAPIIKRELGLSGDDFPAWDVNATCLSALVAMDVAALHIQAGRAANVLVVASEIASRALPWADEPSTAGLFGDGAAAVVLRASAGERGQMLGPMQLETYSEGYDFCTLRAGGTAIDFQAEPDRFAASSFFAMDGHGLYRLSASHAPAFIDRVLAQAGWRHEDVDLVIPHQASPHALAHLARRCGFSEDRVVNFVAEQGNQVAASLPIALYRARAEGRLKPGMKLLLIGTSAGVSLGASTLVW